MRIRLLAMVCSLAAIGGVFVSDAAAFFRRSGIEADFVVAVNGKDTWSGTTSEPTRDGQDGPFASVQRAQQAVRERRARQPSGEHAAVTVLIRHGTYTVDEALLFTPQDSGSSAEAPVTYAAYPGERPVISGGRVITGWRKGEGGVWEADVPEVQAGAWFFSQLFADGQRRPRCRMPNTGYFRIEGPLAPKPVRRTEEWKDPKCRSGFYYAADDLRKWPDLGNMNVTFFHAWTASVHWVEELDEAQRILRFTAGTGWPVGYWETNARYYIENVRAALDSPGEWYLDRAEGKVYYLPLPGERLERFRPIAPVVKQVLRLEGDVEIVCPLGEAQTGTYELAVSASGKSREVFRVAIPSEQWEICAWMVFVSEADGPSEFYLDNLDFQHSTR